MSITGNARLYGRTRQRESYCQEGVWLSQEIRCRKCGKLLAKDKGEFLEIANGDKGAVRIYQAVVVAIDCRRCGRTTDLPVDKRKKVKV